MFRYAKSIITARHRLQCTTRNSVAVVRLDRNYASSVDNVNNTLFYFFVLGIFLAWALALLYLHTIVANP